MRTLILFCLLISLALTACGCAGNTPLDSRPVARDPVCLHNGDLGCIRVRVDESTPRSEYRGETYYFCSAKCKQAFEKNPEEYLPMND